MFASFTAVWLLCTAPVPRHDVPPPHAAALVLPGDCVDPARDADLPPLRQVELGDLDGDRVCDVAFVSAGPGRNVALVYVRRGRCAHRVATFDGETTALRLLPGSSNGLRDLELAQSDCGHAEGLVCTTWTARARSDGLAYAIVADHVGQAPVPSTLRVTLKSGPTQLTRDELATHLEVRTGGGRALPLQSVSGLSANRALAWFQGPSELNGGCSATRFVAVLVGNGAGGLQRLATGEFLVDCERTLAVREETLGGQPVLLMDEGTFDASGHHDFTSVFATQGTVLTRLGRFASQVSEGEEGDHWATMHATPVFVGDEVHVAERWSIQRRTGDAGKEHLSVRRYVVYRLRNGLLEEVSGTSAAPLSR